MKNKTRRLALRSAVLAAPVTAAAVLGSAPAASAATEPVPGTDTVIVTKELRTLAGWESEKVPAYQCPNTHPYLIKENFAPGGTTLIAGVEIDQGGASPWPIGVSITGWVPEIDGYDGKVYSRGISAGALASSATNWDPFSYRSYRVKLHCTDSMAEAFKSDTAP